MKTMTMLATGLALATGAGAAQASERAADKATAPAAADRIARRNHDLGQRYCIVDPSIWRSAANPSCRTLAEWQVNGIDPRRMPRL